MAKAKILIVEDELITAKGIRSTLKSLGYDAFDNVTSGEEAIKKISEICPDLVLMDIKLKGEMDGIEAARQIKDRFNIPVVYMTAHADDATLERAKITEPYGYVIKPFEDRDLHIGIDIALYKHKTEVALKESEEKYRTLVDTTSAIPWEFDTSTERFTFMGAQAVELFGYPIDEWSKEGFWQDHIHPDDREETIKLCMAYTQQSEDHLLEYRMITADKSIVWIYDIVKVIGGNGGPKLLRGVMINITKRKQSERRLSAQHIVTQVLAESVTVKEASPKILQAICTALEWDLGEIWEIDQQNNVLYNTEIWHVPLLKVPEFEAATRQITFAPLIGLPGRVWESAGPLWIADVTHDTGFLRASVADKEGLHGAFGFPIMIGSEVLGTFCFFSHEIRKPDKDLLDMMTAIGRQIGLFIKRKQVEETLLQSEKLRAMGMITAGIAHDFNNILSIISGNAQILEMDYKDNKEMMDRVRTIKNASDDGAEIVRRMSLFTRQKEGTSALLPVDIKRVLEQAVEFTKPRWLNTAKAAGINYNMDYDEVTNVPFIMGDETELREMLINMMNNAMDAMKEGGCLSFRTWQNEENLFLSISDTGEGMSEKVKKRIFEPFYTTKREKGSGLGMSMSYGIIERHGGRIEVDSEVGKGTTFTLRLPIAVLPAQKTESPVEDQKIKTKDLSVLVVDDKEDMRSLLKLFFANSGHTVRTVASGNMAIEVLKAETFDLVLCDLVMPGMSGHEVVAVLNGLEKKPKIGVMTGWSEKIETKDKNELNVDFIIKKPFKFSELTGHINELFI